MPTLQEQEEKYREWIKTHKENAIKAMHELFDMTEIEPSLKERIIETVTNHDNSKYEEPEFSAYRKWFYPVDDNEKSKIEFDLAWSHHQNGNRHHWQYWVMIKDSGTFIPLDMPTEEVLAMITDWRSVSMQLGENSYTWYQKNKDKMILSKATREKVELLVGLFKVELEE